MAASPPKYRIDSPKDKCLVTSSTVAMATMMMAQTEVTNRPKCSGNAKGLSEGW